MNAEQELHAQWVREQDARDVTLRDYFAGKAVIGLLSDPCLKRESDVANKVARAAYMIADAMLIARQS